MSLSLNDELINTSGLTAMDVRTRQMRDMREAHRRQLEGLEARLGRRASGGLPHLDPSDDRVIISTEPFDAAATSSAATATEYDGGGPIPKAVTGGSGAADSASGVVSSAVNLPMLSLLPRTSVAGWAALLRNLPHGLLSLDVRYNALSYDEHVMELRAGRILSPAEMAAVSARRDKAASKKGVGKES